MGKHILGGGAELVRLQHIQQKLSQDQTMLWLSPGDDFRYAVGWSPLGDERLTFLLITPDTAGLVIASVNAEEAVAHLPKDFPIYRFTDDAGPVKVLREVFERVSGGSYRSLMSDDARFDHVRAAVQLAPSPLGLASEVMARARMVKDDQEIQALRQSQAINDRTMEAAYAAARPGMTELELADVIRRAFIQHGADREAFIIVAAGPHSALPHHSPGDTVIGPGPLLLDIGCFYHGYASDMTRVAYLGEPDEKFRAIHAHVEQAVTRAQAAAQPNCRAEEVDRAARAVIDAAGFGPYFVHRTGHGIGLSVHEPPSIMEGNTVALPVGALFSIEPGIYLPGEFGVRLEEVVVMTEDGAQVLSEVPRSIYVKSLKA